MRLQRPVPAAVARAGLLLPIGNVLLFGVFLFISLISPRACATVRCDIIMLLLIVLSPVIYLLGLIAGVLSFKRSQMTITAALAVAVNAGMLAFMAYFAPAYLTEIRIMGW